MILGALFLGPEGDPDISYDSADEMYPLGSLIRKSVISVSRKLGASGEDPFHLPSSPSLGGMSSDGGALPLRPKRGRRP